MKLFFLFLFLFLSPLKRLVAQPIEGEGDAPKKYLMITSFSKQGMTELQLDQINKIMLKVATKQVEYSLALGEGKNFEGVKSTLASMQLQIEKNASVFSIKALLLDIKNKRVIKIETADFIQEANLLLQVKICLEKLFHPTKTEEPARWPKKKELIKNETEKREVENRQNVDNFRDRIKGLKLGIATSIKDLKENQPRIDTQEVLKQQADSKTSQEEESKQSVNGKPSESAEVLALDPPPKPEVSPPFAIMNSMKFGYRVHNTNSKDLVTAVASFKYLNLTYERGFFFDFQKRNQLFLSLSYGKLMNKFTAKVSPYTDLILGYNYFFYDWGFAPGLFLERELFTFINLPTSGEGLVAANNQLNWLKLKFDYNFMIYKFDFITGFYFAKNMFTSSDYLTVSSSSGLVGNKVGFRLQWNNIWKILHSEFEYYKYDLIASGPGRDVTASNSGYVFNALFTF
jgi:hypothetical protein